ncbi:hypothetical protein B0H14DRAFT_1035632 [Mycena olivaceomarginata]|nr:hypothetical protein B0H14DRAFT_1035632 [Mycena olivaceomarginata]
MLRQVHRRRDMHKRSRRSNSRPRSWQKVTGPRTSCSSQRPRNSKKHALTLQLHTAHILSAHASLTQKDRAVEDIREQRNR